MKKLLFLVLICFFLGTLTGNAVELKVLELNNNTGDYQITAVATTRIVPGKDKIYGFFAMTYDASKNTEAVVSLRDMVPNEEGPAGGHIIGNVAEVIAEIEVIDDDTFDGMWFLYPKNVYTQLTVAQGANTSVLIYYGR